jgi:molybdenum cofactor synthesis domain-containing protein
MEHGNPPGPAGQRIVTAAMVAIGDELLSGRTRDRNIGYLAGFLTLSGIELKEVRIVGDEIGAIVEAVNALRLKHDYVFTSGGIGPTHDDITADAIGAAFSLPVEFHSGALEILSRHYDDRGLEFTDARRRMARMPRGSELIDNPVSAAPGFVIGNVFVMAGVPSIFQAMVDSAADRLEGGLPMLSQPVACPFPEGRIGTKLAEIHTKHRDTAIGSYPRFDGQDYSTEIVVRGRDAEKVEAAAADVRAMIEEIKAKA